MPVETTLAGLRIGLQRPLVLVALPVAAVLVGLAFRRRERAVFTGRSRALFLTSRLLLVTLLVVAAAGPYTLATTDSTGKPTVTMLVDRSASMATTDAAPGDLAAAIENEGVAVRTRTVGSETDSPVGDAVTSALAPNGSVLLVSDGRVTSGRSLDAAAGVAERVGASIHAVSLDSNRTERAVTVSGPAKTSTGVANQFRVTVDGTALSGTETTLTVSIDGQQIRQETVAEAGGLTFTYNFSSTGSHRVTARIEGGDVYDRNDVFRKTVRVVEPPKILYVSRGDYAFEGFLRDVYDVDTVESIPANLSGYYAVVVQNVAAGDLGNVSALQRAVIDGTGLVTVGGPSAFERGDYRESLLTDLLPVTIGEGGETSRVVVAVDISGSTSGSMSAQQALALDVLNQLGDENRVGIVAFNNQVYRIAGLTGLGNSRSFLEDRIRRLESTGSTDVSAGIEGATRMLGGSGTVILLTDGRAYTGDAPAAAARASERGIEVIPVGVGNEVAVDYLQQVADAGEGVFLRADESSKLRIEFGGETREFQGSGLTVLDRTHFITSGVEFTARPARTHSVAAARGADLLVAGSDGAPAITAWRYGLGRTVAITAYGENGGLDGLLSAPDSLGITKSVNWAIGDPERLATGITSTPDARVGSPATATYEGANRPSADGYRFVQVDTGEYETTFVPASAGYQSLLAAEFAVNYPREFAAFGQSRAVRTAVERSGGGVFEPGQAAAIAEQVRQEASTVETVTREWTWLVLVVALVLYLVEVGTRRLVRIRHL
ncbi:vWA domain-containing protein [Halorientalis regularis]|uniref:Mg-chelatase subunit ChlD n=1 Tax=Halorientalis regularis TaxID=660518 RepID=A0A1G7JAU1_9EURY|nr:vWA domain-containing protein [Halorientalis regularis]SDF21599.1 Mg-chelatase subunit ChlD [Halorientalis regularis]